VGPARGTSDAAAVAVLRFPFCNGRRAVFAWPEIFLRGFTRRANNNVAGLFRSWQLILRAGQYVITTSHLRLPVQRFK